MAYISFLLICLDSNSSGIPVSVLLLCFAGEKGYHSAYLSVLVSSRALKYDIVIDSVFCPENLMYGLTHPPTSVGDTCIL